MEISINSIIRILLGKIWVIIIAAVLGMALLFAYTFFLVDPLYKSTAQMYVYNSANAGDKTSVTTSDLNAAKQLVDTYIVILKSKSVTEPVAEKLKDKYPNLTANKIESYFAGASLNSTECFEISVTTNDPEMSYDIMEAIVEVAPGRIKEVIPAGQASIIEPPQAPSGSSWPIVRNTVIGFLIGAVIASGIVILLSFLDTLIYTREELSERYNLPVIGAIPLLTDIANVEKVRGKRSFLDIVLHRKPKKDARSAHEDRKNLITADTPFNIAEAYRSTRTNILYLPSDGKCEKIAFTSSVSMEGKTIATMNTAITMAQNGKRVLLIDGDMRKPRIAKNLGIKPESGLSEFLANVTDTVCISKTNYENLSVIASGKATQNASELLASPRMKQLLDAIEDDYDYVFIDTPPMALVTDASVIADMINGYIIVTFAGFTDRNAISDTLEALKQVNANVYGFLINGVNPKASAYGRYGKYGKYGYSKYGYSKYGYSKYGYSKYGYNSYGSNYSYVEDSSAAQESNNAESGK